MQSWQQELQQAYTEPRLLLQDLALSADDIEAIELADQAFATRVPRSFVSRMQKGDPTDPLLLQVLPQKQENQQTPGYSADPLDEHQAVQPSLLHKYQSRVLWIVTGGCAVNCRYCFRRSFPYQDNIISTKQWQRNFDYIKARPEINEVILSGGDPLLLPDSLLKQLFAQLAALPQLKRIRIHTRTPVVLPSRITEELLQIFKTCLLDVIVVLHVNHPNELDSQTQAPFLRLAGSVKALLNQSVLLAGVNDDASTLAQLSEKLFAQNVLPYYLHLLDKVEGASHFDIVDDKSSAIYRELQTLLPGFLVPKLVKEIAGEPNKTIYT